jgi:hypothetical protein
MGIIHCKKQILNKSVESYNFSNERWNKGVFFRTYSQVLIFYRKFQFLKHFFMRKGFLILVTVLGLFSLGFLSNAQPCATLQIIGTPGGTPFHLTHILLLALTQLLWV